MLKELDQILKSKGLQKISSFNDLIYSNSFLVFSNYGDGTKFPIYPVTKKKNFIHDALNLYGTHWRYLISTNDFNQIKKEDGDLEITLKNIKLRKKERRFAVYSFAERMIKFDPHYWIFVPNTEGWEYYQNILIPRFNKDNQEYQKLKEKKF